MASEEELRKLAKKMLAWGKVEREKEEIRNKMHDLLSYELANNSLSTASDKASNFTINLIEEYLSKYIEEHWEELNR